MFRKHLPFQLTSGALVLGIAKTVFCTLCSLEEEFSSISNLSMMILMIFEKDSWSSLRYYNLSDPLEMCKFLLLLLLFQSLAFWPGFSHIPEGGVWHSVKLWAYMLKNSEVMMLLFALLHWTICVQVIISLFEFLKVVHISLSPAIKVPHRLCVFACVHLIKEKTIRWCW